MIESIAILETEQDRKILKNDSCSAVEAAAILNVNERTIRRAIQRGELPAVREGRSFAINRRDLEHYAQQLTPSGSANSVNGVASVKHQSSRTGGDAPLIGREHDLTRLMDLLRSADTHLVTLVGAGGIGKTRLSLAAATYLEPDMPDGVVVANLASVTDAAIVPEAVAAATQIYLGNRTASDAVIDWFANRTSLILLDNFEHVLAATWFVERLIEKTPVLLLVTSREPLGIDGEQIFPVSSLAIPHPGQSVSFELHRTAPAVRLFVDRARTIDPAFRLTAENALAISEIVRRVDGLPLAIELAAARVSEFTPEGLLLRLEQRLPVLVGGSRDLPERHRTLRGAIDWSFALLSGAEQRSFECLSALPAGFDREIAHFLLSSVVWPAGTTAQSEDQDPGPLELPDADLILERLVAGSLLTTDDSGRFVMLETIREYGLQRLDASDTVSTVRKAVVDYYVDLTTRFADEYQRTRQISSYDQISIEIGNIRVAMQWAIFMGLSEQSLRMTGNLYFYWVGRGLLREGIESFESALSVEGPTDALLRVKALMEVGWLASRLSDQARADNAYHEAQQLIEVNGLTDFQNELTICTAVLRQEQGRLDESIGMFESAMTIASRNGDSTQVSNIENNLGLSRIHQGRLDEAQGHFERALEHLRSIGDVRRIANTLGNLGMVSSWMGDVEKSAQMYREAYEMHLVAGDQQGRFISLMNLASCEIDRGNLDSGIPMTDEAIAGLRQLGERMYVAIAQANLADAVASRGEFARSLDLSRESLLQFESIGNHVYVAEVLEITGRLLAETGNWREAATAFGVANRYWSETGATRDASYQKRHSQIVADLRTALGPVEYQRLLDEAREKPVDLVASMTRSVRESLIRPTGEVTDGTMLTARELEVLRLLADGLTDQQIADNLFLSRRTVSTHVANMLNKLGVDSRTAVASSAIRQGLI